VEKYLVIGLVQERDERIKNTATARTAFFECISPPSDDRLILGTYNQYNLVDEAKPP
jgi:hypothetical protein